MRVKAFKSYLFFGGLCFSLFSFAQISFAQDEPNLLIRPECQETFQKGIEYYFAKIEKKDLQNRNLPIFSH